MIKSNFEVKTVVKVLSDNTVITVKYLVSPNQKPQFFGGSYVRKPQLSSFS